MHKRTQARKIALLLLIELGVLTAGQDALRGVRYRNETVFDTLSHASMAGGLELFIDGSGMDEQAFMNSVLFSSTQTVGLELTGTPADIDDQIQSATSLGRLAYTLPSLPDLFGGVPMESFANHYTANAETEPITFELKVQNAADETVIECPVGLENQCKVQYRLRYTPQLFDISPSNVYHDQTLNFRINPAASNYDWVMKADAEPVDFIKLSGTRTDSEGYFTSGDRLSGYTVSNLKTRSGDQAPGDSIPEVRFRTGNAYLRDSSKHCNFAGDECWYVRTHPKIDSVSAATGYTTGGQELKINGWGLKGDTLADVQVTVDGVPCTVTGTDKEYITCKTGAATAPSLTGVSQPGSPGLTQTKMDSSDPYWEMRTDGLVAPYETTLQTAFENHFNSEHTMASLSKGWFKAPETGNYRFYISCDDKCKLFLDATNPFNAASPVEPTVTEVAARHWAIEWRHYFVTPEAADINQYITQWIPMQAGEFYKIEGFMMEWNGNDHFTVSVEFEQASTAGHHHAVKEIQEMRIDQTNVAEIFDIVVDSPTGGNFKIQFVNPKYQIDNLDFLFWATEYVNDSCTSGTMREAIKGYFSKVWGSDVSVTKTMYDAADLETTDSALTVKNIYRVEVLKRIDGPSHTSAVILPGTSSATVTITTIQESSIPMSGSFTITCPDENGVDFSTKELPYTEWTQGIDFYMQLQIPHLQFKIYVRNLWDYWYRENGVAFAVVFQDYHGDVPECRIESGVTDPIVGNSPVFSTTTTRTYGTNLMFEPVPLEMLYTDAQQPQVMVKVNGIEGVCPSFNCDYTYVDSTSLITSQSISGDILTILGTNLPTAGVRVALANSVCDTVSASPTQITCTLTTPAAAGSWDVQVTDSSGLIPIDSTIAQISIALTLTGVSPASGLNQLGGDILTLSGTGLDQIMDGTSVDFSDGTTCQIQSTSATQLTCMIDGFDSTTLNTVNPYTLTVTVNGVVDSTQSVTILSTKQSGVSVVPSSVSPVLASVLTVSLESTYPHVLAKEDFKAHLVNAVDTTVTRPLYVMSVDDASKSIQIKFPGAESGNYHVQVSSTQVGRIDQAPLVLEVLGKITGISHATGSSLGGTLITIDGVNFSDDPLDNPVKVGDHYCYVKETSATQIKCRVAATGVTDVITSNVLVFLRTSEEAQSDVSTVYDFVAPLRSMTGMTNAFDAATNSHTFTVTGTSFPAGDVTGVSLYIDDVQQETVSVTADTAVFKVTEMAAETSNNVQVYFDDGLASGYEAFTSATVVPSLVSVSPSVGSAGGTLLTVTGTGFGPATQGVNLKHVSSGTSICDEVTVTGYGSFTCMTTAMDIASADQLQIVTASGTFSCANTLNSAECSFTQLATGSPTVSSVTLTDSTTLDFVGTDFPTANYDAVAIFQGVESTSAVISSSGAVTATFAKGVPVVDVAATPVLRFDHQTLNERLVAVDGGVTFANAMTIGSSTSGLSCSFQGGCTYSVAASGLASSLLAEGGTNQIDVCGNRCVVDADLSSAAEAVCRLPHVSTSYSAANFETVTQGLLHDGTWSGTASAAELAKLTDNKNMVDMVDTAAPCHFQIQYKENHVGVLDEVKFFVNVLIDKTPFVGDLVFQGSDDGVNFTDLWTVDASVHEGWNVHDFETSKPSFNIYRFAGASNGSCRIGEVRLLGIEAINSDTATFDCTPKLVLDGVTTALNPVTFDGSMTPVLTGMSDRYGSVLGGESVTFYGTGFSATSTTTVTIDNRDCAVTSQTVSSITCTTMDKPYVADEPKLVIHIDGVGNVATKGMVYRYVSRWSDDQTWNYDLSPQDGDAVNIPKGLHLLVDIDASPKLSFVNVEGSLIFAPDADPNHQRTFDAHYIMVKGGYMEVGTEDHRYTSKLTITMHSTKYDPNLPIFGNKVIGVNYGVLEMHGAERSHVWTDLKVTADIGATQITLNDITGGVPLDWQVGEDIVIASTDISGRHAEQRTIASITNQSTNPVITFTQPLEYKHYAGIQYFGTDFIEMRAEVGLLTRNVKYQGDPETSPDNQYGAVIIMHSPGDESTAARIDSIELTNVGQAFILGSYPIHFHMIGTVHSSYVRNNSIHHTFNRAVTIHGVHFLRVQNNVAYHTMGHTIFIEDAAETSNLIEDNLVVDVRRSWSLLNTDTTPACFWITNPNNIFRRNHAAGSDRYSYWFDTQKTAIGPSYDENICPENTKLGEFVDNVAHSNGRYGLRIFHNLIPRTHPCEPMVYDPADPANPYPANPPIIAEFRNLVSYKNGRNGAIAERVGAVQFHNFKTADNVLAGIEFSLTEDIVDGYAKIVGGLVVGRTENTEEQIDIASPHGIITPRTENFSIEGTKFYNYNWNNAAGLGTCSHCFHPASTDSGARTVRVSGLSFDTASVSKRIFYQYPFRAIFFDEDGSLTNLGPGSWATPYWKHNDQVECTVNDPVFNGITCPNTVQVRRIAFYGYTPGHFDGMAMKIAQFEKADMKTRSDAGTLQTYLDDEANYSVVIFKSKLLPSNGWAMPFVTGKRYRIHWAEGLDFDRMKFDVSERWEGTDDTILINMNFTETREAVNFTYSGGQIDNTTLLNTSVGNAMSGDNVVWNDTAVREIEFAVSGNDLNRSTVTMLGLRCIAGTCPLEEIVEVPLEEGQRLWSDTDNWGGTLPQEGDDVEIPSGWNMILDLEETPILNSLTINGRLSFLQMPTMNVHLRANWIFVRAGELFIGSAEAPFEEQAKITLYGDQDSETLILSGTVSAGNKILATSGDVRFFGKPRDRMARLLAPVYMGKNTIIVEEGLDWQAGDEIYIAPSAMQHDHSEYRTIVSYVGSLITLDQPLNHYHWGDGLSTADAYNGVDMRTEVILLTRNVVIQGADTDGWGGQILATDLFEASGAWRKGQIEFDNVQVYNCSQRNTYKSAIRFEGAIGGSSKVSNSVVHGSLAWSVSIYKSNNVILENSAFVGARAIGVHMDLVRNVTMDNTFTGDVLKRALQAGDSFVDKEACVAVCSYMTEGSKCYDLRITNNVAAGCVFGGFVVPGHDCGASDSQQSFRNNIAHSNDGAGAYIYPSASSSSHSSCYEGSFFSGYKNQLNCVATHYKTKDMRMRHLTCIDNAKGVSLQTGGDAQKLAISLYDSKIYGETAALDCPDTANCWCHDKMGFMFFGNNFKGKPLHPTMASQLPVYKIKSEGSWGGDILVYNVDFLDWKSPDTACKAKQRIFMRNKYASDKIPYHSFKNSKFVDVHDSALAWFQESPRGWANLSDCGQWPCTAPENVVLNFQYTSFSGLTPAGTYPSFQIVSDAGGPDVASKFAQCESRKGTWNGYFCRNQNLGMLLFESLDEDTYDRSIQPINILNEAKGFNNTVNSMMDHVWDGFYTGQLRLSRFPAQIETQQDYTVNLAGTPPKKMRFTLTAQSGGTKIKIPYPVAGAYTVSVNGNKIDYTPWDEEIGRAKALTKTKGCGENRYVGIENFLEFYLTPGCEVRIDPMDSIMTKVRLDWTLEEFYADGGTTRFVDRLAASLGIDAYRIKTIAVYQGSVIVDFYISALPVDEDDNDAVSTTQQLQIIKQQLVTGIEGNLFDFGAPILGMQTAEGEVIAGDPIPGPNDMTTGDHSAIVGDTNLWDNLDYNKNGEVIAGDNNSSSTSTNSGATTTDTSSSTTTSGSDSTTTDEMSRVQVVQVTVAESETSADASANQSNIIILVPVVVAVILLVVAITIMVRCFTQRRNEVKQISEHLEQRVRVDTNGSSYVDSQYQFNDNEKDKGIFARTNQFTKVNRADNVVSETQVDAFDSQSRLSSQASHSSSAQKLNAPQESPDRRENNLGDSLRLNKK